MREKVLISGDSYPVLEQALFSDIAGLKKAAPLAPVVVLVGSNLLARHLRRGLAWFMQRAGQAGGHVGVNFITFPDLAGALLQGHPSMEGKQPIRTWEDRYVARRIAEQIDDGYFAPVSELPGFSSALLRTFHDLDEAGIGELPLPLSSGVRGKGGDKMVDLALLRQKYLRLKGGRLGRDDIIGLAAAAPDRFAHAFSADRLHVYGFYDFTFVQRRLLSSLGDFIDIKVYFPVPGRGHDLSIEGDCAGTTLQWINAEGFVSSPEPSGTQQAQTPEPAGPSRQSGRPGLTVISAPNEESEVREIAREVLDLAANGVRFDEMMVLTRDDGTYTGLLKDIFGRCGIPFYLRRGRSLDRTRTGRALTLLCHLMSGNATRRDLIEFTEHAGYGHPDWESITCKAGCTDWPKPFNRNLSDFCDRQKWLIDKLTNEGAAEERIVQARSTHDCARRLLALSSALASEIEQFRSASSWSSLVDRLLTVAARHIDLKALGEDEIPVARRAAEELNNLRSLDNLGPAPDWPTFALFVKEALEGAALPSGAFQRGVTISDVIDARGLTARVVFLPGLIEGRFPAPVRQDPILLDSERYRINRSIVQTLPEAGTADRPLALIGPRASEEGLLFNLAVTSAMKKLILTFPRLQGPNGGKTAPSWFLADFCDRLYGRRVNLASPDPDPAVRFIPLVENAPSSPESAIDEAEFDLSALQVLKDRQAAADYLQTTSPHSSDCLRAVSSRRLRNTLTAYDGHISSTAAKEALSLRINQGTFSPTQLEDYANCPFSYFVKSLLRVEPLDRPEEQREPNARELGAAIHRILQQFFTELAKRGRLPLRFDQLQENTLLLRDIATKKLAWFARRHPVGYQLTWDVRVESILEGLDKLVETETGLTEDIGLLPSHFEVEIAPDVLTIQLPNNRSIQLIGRIDRVDLPPEEMPSRPLRVIDYKSGKLSNDKYQIYSTKNGRFHLQLPLYLLAACSKYGCDISKSTAEYMATTTKTAKQRTIFKGSDWNELSKPVLALVQGVVDGMTAGFFTPYPQNSCERCDYRQTCAPNPESSIALKTQAGPYQDFLTMRGIR